MQVASLDRAATHVVHRIAVAGKQIFEKGSRLPKFDDRCRLTRLPHVFGTKKVTIPTPGPYLSAKKDQISYWEHRLGKKEKPRIGISSQGNKDHQKDYARTI